MVLEWDGYLWAEEGIEQGDKNSTSNQVLYVTLNMVALGGHPELCLKSVFGFDRLQFLQFFKGILPGRSFGI